LSESQDLHVGCDPGIAGHVRVPAARIHPFIQLSGHYKAIFMLRSAVARGDDEYEENVQEKDTDGWTREDQDGHEKEMMREEA
jgi:hypothetical protein